jgi:hypothetical protein
MQEEIKIWKNKRGTGTLDLGRGRELAGKRECEAPEYGTRAEVAE